MITLVNTTKTEWQTYTGEYPMINNWYSPPFEFNADKTEFRWLT